LFVCCLRENGKKLQAENRQGSILTGQSTTLYRGCSEQRAVSAFGFKTVPDSMSDHPEALEAGQLQSTCKFWTF